MARKYENYFVKITENKNVKHDPKITPVWGTVTPPQIFDKRVYSGSPVHIEVLIVHKAGGIFGQGDPTDGIIAGKKLLDLPMTHPCDEIIIFAGMNPANPDDLEAEIEYWIGEGKEAEKYTITEATAIFVPKNVVHMPIYFKKVTRPFAMFAILMDPEWHTDFIDVLPPGFKKKTISK